MTISAEDVYREYYESDQTPQESQIIELNLDPPTLIVVDETSGKYYSVEVIVSGEECTFGKITPVANYWTETNDPEEPTLGPSGGPSDDQGTPLAARAGGRKPPAGKAARWPYVVAQTPPRRAPVDPQYARQFPPDTAPAPGEDMIDFAARTGRVLPDTVGRYKRQRDAAVRASADPPGTRAAIDASYLRLPPAQVAGEAIAADGRQQAEDRFAGLWPPTTEAADEADKIAAAAEDREYERRRTVREQAVKAAAGDDQLARLFGPDWDRT